jgi:hypothetical protein
VNNEVKSNVVENKVVVKEEKIVKMCIDYILYNTHTPTQNNSQEPQNLAENSTEFAILSGMGSVFHIHNTPKHATNYTNNTNNTKIKQFSLQPTVVLSHFSDEYMHEMGYLPSRQYPSDHLAVCCDLEVIDWM